jgi:hypothetical protein
MKKIENIMEQNREFLNTEEPPEGHFERFEQKLSLQHRRRSFMHKAYTLARIAAIVIIVVISAVWIKYNQSGEKENKSVNMAKTQELKEAEQFYARLLELSYENIKKINFPDESQKLKILKDVSQKDESYTRIKEDLQSDPTNEMAQQAMINYYETRVEAVNQIVANLKQVLNSNS